jgi:hypothetical protein
MGAEHMMALEKAAVVLVEIEHLAIVVARAE